MKGLNSVKRIAIFSLLIFLLIASVVPVLAGGGRNRSSPYVMNGTVLTVDSQSRTITMATLYGPFSKGEEIVVSTTDRTRYSWQTEAGCDPIEFDLLEMGQLVGVTGLFENDLFIATRIKVKIQ
jgi:hypothetical protein